MENNLWQDLYSNHPDRYDRLVQAEDYQGQLIAALPEIHPMGNSELAELGAGTGRLTLQLLPHVRRVYAFDLTSPMLQLAHRKLTQSGSLNWSLATANSRAVPLPARSVDITVEGWSFVQIMTWNLEKWQQEVGRAIQEMLRIVRPGGALILIETLGTGETQPNPPALFKSAYEYFEREWQFAFKWIRTDYRFATQEQVRQVVVPIFGESMAERTIQSEAGIILPECTGVWWRYG